MRVFKIKKGGDVENSEDAFVVLSRPIDEDLLKTAINICAEKNLSIQDTLQYIDRQFNCLDFVTLSDVETFYC